MLEVLSGRRLDIRSPVFGSGLELTKQRETMGQLSMLNIGNGFDEIATGSFDMGLIGPIQPAY